MKAKLVKDSLLEYGGSPGPMGAPLAGSQNYDKSTRSLVDIVGDLEQRIWNSDNRDAIRKWDNFTEDSLYGDVTEFDTDDEVGERFWDDLDDWDLEQIIQFGEKLIAEFNINEYYAPSALIKAKADAIRISKEEGVAQHVNEIRPGIYKVEDWYDADTTVASYENGKRLDESLNEWSKGNSPEVFKQFGDELEKRRIPCRILLSETGAIDVLCGFDYPDSLFDKIYDVAESLGIEVNIQADMSGPTPVDRRSIAGGPKRYSRW